MRKRKGDKNFEDVLGNINNLKEVEEVLDKTEVYLKLIETTRNLDRIDRAQQIWESTRKLVETLTEIIHPAPEVQVKALETFNEIVKDYHEDEEAEKKRRFREIFGFGKKPKEEATENARKEVRKILNEIGQSSSISIQILKEAQRLMMDINRQLNQLLDEANLDPEDEQKLRAIRKQISSKGN